MNLSLSIIIPVYNVEKYISTCMESIVQDAAIKNGQIEVIIVDDGSDDRSGLIADEFAKEYDFFHVLHKSNQGVAKARNTGMETANGEWLHFMDSDDWLEKGAVSHILKCCKENADADIILFDAYKNTGDREEVWEHFANNMVWYGREGIKELQREVLYFHRTPLAAPWDKVYKNSFLKQNEIQFNEELRVLDDMVFNVEAFGAASKIVYCKEKIYHYRYVPDSITNQYKPDRVEQDVKVWNYLQEYMAGTFPKAGWRESEKAAFLQAYFCRVIKSFSICCRLCFFNEQNDKNLPEKLKDVRTVLTLPLYREAFHKVKLKNAEWRLKIVVMLGRCRAVFGIYLLHLLNTWQIKYGKMK